MSSAFTIKKALKLGLVICVVIGDVAFVTLDVHLVRGELRNNNTFASDIGTAVIRSDTEQHSDSSHPIGHFRPSPVARRNDRSKVHAVNRGLDPERKIGSRKVSKSGSGPIGSIGEGSFRSPNVPGFGTVKLTVDPSNAVVDVDGEVLSDTEMISGKRLESGKKVGLLNVYSYPWSNIYVDSVLLGLTPTPRPISLSEGKHLVVLRRDGFKPHAETVQIISGDITRIQRNLEKEESIQN